jgi:hypothetical protein
MLPNKDYLDSIKAKLDSMNKVSGVDPTNKIQGGQVYGEPKLEDPMDWAGKAAIEYLRSKGKNPNLSDI